MKKSLLAIALAVVMTPFVFAAQTPGTGADKPAATTHAKVKKAKGTKVTKSTKGKHAAKATKAAAAPKN